MKDNDFEKLWNSGATARKYSQCSISDHELETIIGNAIERDNKTRKKHFPIWQKPYVYLAMVAACVAAVVVGLWQLRINSVLIPNTPEALQPSPTILVAQTTDKPATITDNEIKNSADHTTNKYNHTGYTENKHSNGTCDIRTIKEYEVKDNSSTSNLLNINAHVRDSSNILLAQSATDGDTAMLTMVHNQYKADTNNIGIITYCNINCESNNIASMMINILST